MLLRLLKRRRNWRNVLYFVGIAWMVRLVFWGSASRTRSQFETARDHEIAEHGFIERATHADRSLNVQKHKFMQARLGRDELQARRDLFGEIVRAGTLFYWERFQLPFTGTTQDTENVLSAIEQLLTLNGWVAAACPTLLRPFGQNSNKQARQYDDLIGRNHLYYVAIVIHSADHFLVDQLAVIVQMAKRLGNDHIFVSMLDYDSSDSTETLIDLCEAVLTLLNIPFRIRRVAGMTQDAAAAYYPIEEAHTRNLALEPLHELSERRKITFSRVIWLKGFTCPNDILESIKVSFENEAVMVCGMDWAEHNGAFVFSDRWRTRDIEGNQFHQSKSSKEDNIVPPRDQQSAVRYAKHLPFQVFCCEAGTHIVDPSQSYYKGIKYRAGSDYQNLTTQATVPERDPDSDCLDSSQSYFCRDLWVWSAKEGMEEIDKLNGGLPLTTKKPAVQDEKRSFFKFTKRDPAEEPGQLQEVEAVVAGEDQAKRPLPDPDANVGSDYDAIPDEEGGDSVPLANYRPLSIPNNVFRPARILVNPRCVTTYAGVSHAQLARDLFADEDHQSHEDERTGKYVLDDWEGAPESFVCQELKQTGGRSAPKTQRRLGFSIHDELHKL